MIPRYTLLGTPEVAQAHQTHILHSSYRFRHPPLSPAITCCLNIRIKHSVIFQVKYIWTSGRLCDFKGCNRPDLLPNEVNGWFWTAELQKLAPSTNRQQNDWSEGGGIGKAQPDNRVSQNTF